MDCGCIRESKVALAMQVIKPISPRLLEEARLGLVSCIRTLRRNNPSLTNVRCLHALGIPRSEWQSLAHSIRLVSFPSTPFSQEERFRVSSGVVVPPAVDSGCKSHTLLVAHRRLFQRGKRHLKDGNDPSPGCCHTDMAQHIRGQHF
jgi:hypothetical protein